MRLFQKDAYIGMDFLNKKTEIIKLKTPQDVDAFSFDLKLRMVSAPLPLPTQWFPK
jgi:hypothetical protein